MTRSPSPPPWRSAASLAADLPIQRDAWLARVLPLLRAIPTDTGIAAELGLARSTWALMRRWLRAEHAAGRLPEWGDAAWPEPVVGARVGAPLRGAARIGRARKHELSCG